MGFVSFGGPAGQIALLHQELVERRRWISEKRFLHALNYCMLLPGPEAQQLATYVGWLLHKSFGPALVDDNSPLPVQAQFNKSRFISYCTVGLWLWLAPIAALLALFGWHGVLTQMDWFFTKAALLTFGGAYAVLPYVFQGAVDHYGWLTATQRK